MSIEGEAAGDVLTGAVVAATVEGKAGAQTARTSAATCRNCGAALSGKYCASCGQPAHIHRTLSSLFHDILHGVFHFEGKVWRTIPELYFHPGRLTRRYIDGERAKFVSPMALFLFTVFLTFAFVPFTTGNFLDEAEAPGKFVEEFKAGNQTAMEATLASTARLQEELKRPGIRPERRAQIEKQLADNQDAVKVMEALSKGDWKGLAEFEEKQSEERKAAASDNKADTGWPALDSRLNQSLKELNDNPRLLFYKLKSNGYKYSWALIPLSLPFMWLLFFWRRDIHLYDHAIFVTYSLCFMLQLLVMLAIAAKLGAGAGLLSTAFGIAAPIHLYKQLRGAYGLSRFGAAIRLFFLAISISIVTALFSALLVVLGVLA